MTATHARIVTLATDLAFDEVPSLERVSLVVEYAHRRWTSIKGKIPARIRGNNNYGGSAKPAFSTAPMVIESGAHSPASRTFSRQWLASPENGGLAAPAHRGQ